jgi:protein-tyrosine phosphatase
MNPLSIIKRAGRAVLRRASASVALLNARRNSHRRLARGEIRRILVVCYGNIYRSAFVGEILRTALRGRIEVRSAGFHPVAERCSPEAHVRMCAGLNVDLSTHRSSVISAEDVEWADTIILMDRHNWTALRALGAPQDKLVWLGALIPGPVEIRDPYGMNEAAARDVVGRLHGATQMLLTRHLR